MPPSAATAHPVVRHHFTVDVEEHFQVLALAPYAPRERWGSFESRVARNVDRLLELLARRSATGTFFTLGWVAERQPAMVKAIAAAGHEMASHGDDHRRVTELTPDEFRAQVRRSKRILEDLTGQPCLGYRAPNYSIVPGREWALDILIDEGYRYDSSLFPIQRPGYGYAGGGRDPHWLERPGGRLLEVPPATLRRLGLNLPAAGGAYFRLLPFGLVRAALRDAERRGQPGTFYLHPWEYDAAQPRFAVPFLTRVRHYGGLAGVLPRLERLLEEFRFVSIAEGLALRVTALA
jgi:polysaccharide deacetylase family protein (PEP-CTERM system associated)